jgi:uncharacterized Fe-S cluster protein YjdI
MAQKTFKYSNGEITVIWKPELCIHSTKCFHGLPNVFDPRKRPWVNALGDTTNAIIEQVKLCPSGALSYTMTTAETEADTPAPEHEAPVSMELLPNGPLLVKGEVVIKKADGTEEHKTGNTALCRCGASKNKPYCDGSHRNIDFEG